MYEEDREFEPIWWMRATVLLAIAGICAGGLIIAMWSGVVPGWTPAGSSSRHEAGSPQQVTRSRAPAAVLDESLNWQPAAAREEIRHLKEALQQSAAAGQKQARDLEHTKMVLSLTLQEERALRERQRATERQASAAMLTQLQERDRVQALDRHLAAAREQIQALKARQGEADRQAAVAERELANERARALTLDVELSTVREQIEALKESLTNSDGTAAAAELKQGRDHPRGGTLHDQAAPAQEIDAQHARHALQQVAAAEQQSAQERARAETLAHELASTREEIEALQARHAEAIRKATLAEQESAQYRTRVEHLDGELAASRRDIEGLKVQQADRGQQARAEEEVVRVRTRAEVLERELAESRQTIAALAARQSNAIEQVANAERQWNQDRARSEILERELAIARQEIEALRAHRGVALAQVGPGERHLVRERAESATHQRDATLAGEEAVTTARSPATVEARTSDAAMLGGAGESSRLNQPDQAEGPARGMTATGARPNEMESGRSLPPLRRSDDEERFLARAAALVSQGSIAGARLWLEAAAASGSARAAFALAETYDPDVLMSWRTHGILADPSRALDLYVLAYSRGLSTANERVAAMQEKVRR